LPHAVRSCKQPVVEAVQLKLRGLLLDSRTVDLRAYGPPGLCEGTPMSFAGPPQDCQLQLDGVVYTSVFNPYDGRKNWQDMISAFCTTFRDVADATLVLKLTHHDIANALNDMLHHLYKNQSYQCRIVLIHGYLADADYEALVQATSYVVNSSYGEGSACR
jgi:glycosyltransferase involved in cell wall biosynthesis